MEYWTSISTLAPGHHELRLEVAVVVGLFRFQRSLTLGQWTTPRTEATEESDQLQHLKAFAITGDPIHLPTLLVDQAYDEDYAPTLQVEGDQVLLTLDDGYASDTSVQLPFSLARLQTLIGDSLASC